MMMLLVLLSVLVARCERSQVLPVFIFCAVTGPWHHIYIGTGRILGINLPSCSGHLPKRAYTDRCNDIEYIIFYHPWKRMDQRE